MRFTGIIALLSVACLCHAQVSFKTITPGRPVVAGEPFRVQYVLSGPVKGENLATPDFRPFQLVSGPEIYPGDGSSNTRNYIFTLVATSPGRFTVPGAFIRYEGKTLRSNSTSVEVVPADRQVPGLQDAGGEYQLRPGENVQEKIRKNLFVRVSVNRNSCYAGEPVLATFRLYSRLFSHSDIVKNPGFYGFTVHDMISLDDKVEGTEMVNGLEFDVHTIRQVQLFPLQPGVFSIDPMQVKNKVKFSKSAVNRKAEQEIVEGIGGLNENDPEDKEADVYEADISTQPVTITVNPLPAKNQPEGFSGAVGQYAIIARLAKNELYRNEEGYLEIVLSGKGNFVQLDAPGVNWPASVEGFEPAVTDSLEKTSMPLRGSRTFRYPFVCSAPGTYTLPALRFSYFDPVAGSYKTLTTEPLQVVVTASEKTTTPVTEEKKVSINQQSEKAARIAGIVVVALVLLILLYWGLRKKEKPEEKPVPKVVFPSPDVLLEPAETALAEGSPEFFSKLHLAVWTFLRQRLDISGTDMNKQAVAKRLADAGAGDDAHKELMRVTELCETGIYTNADTGLDKAALLADARNVLHSLAAVLD